MATSSIEPSLQGEQDVPATEPRGHVTRQWCVCVYGPSGALFPLQCGPGLVHKSPSMTGPGRPAWGCPFPGFPSRAVSAVGLCWRKKLQKKKKELWNISAKLC